MNKNSKFHITVRFTVSWVTGRASGRHVARIWGINMWLTLPAGFLRPN